MSRFAACLLLIAACSGGSKQVKQTGGPKAHVGQGSHQSAGHPTPPVGAGAGAVSAVPDIGCLAPTCVYHAGTATYLTCLAGGAGTCFHFGAPCAPADSCMFDPADKTYKQCSSVVEGVCQQWAAACAPTKACMFSPADGLHHTCDEVAGGTCRKYGALCAP